VAAFAGDVPTLLAMRAVSHLWLGAVRHRAVAAHAVSVEVPTLPIFMSTLAFSSPRVRCDLPLADFSSDAPQSQRMFFVAMAMLCEVDAPSMEEQESEDVAVAAAADADLVLDLCVEKDHDSELCTCRSIKNLWTLRRGTAGARRLRGVLRWQIETCTKASTSPSGLSHGSSPAQLPPRLRVLGFCEESNVSLAEIVEPVTLRHLKHLEIHRVLDYSVLPQFVALSTLRVHDGGGVDAAVLADVLAISSLRRLEIQGVRFDTWTTAVRRLALAERVSPLTLLWVWDAFGDEPSADEFPRHTLLPPSTFVTLRHVAILSTRDNVPSTRVAQPQLEGFGSDFGDSDCTALGATLGGSLQHFQCTHYRRSTANVAGESLGAYCNALRSLGTIDCQGLADAFLRRCSDDGAKPVGLRFLDAAFDRLSPDALNTMLPEARVIELVAPTLSRTTPTLFRSLFSLRRLVIDDVTCAGALPDSFWGSLADARPLEELTVRSGPELPPLTDVAVPPHALKSLWRVTITMCPRMLADEGTWRFLWRLPALRDVATDFTPDAADAAVAALRACVAAGHVSGIAVASMTINDGGHLTENPFPSGQFNQLLAATTSLRELRLFRCLGVPASCLDAIAGPELLHTLQFDESAAETSTITRHATRFRSLRVIIFPGGPHVDAAEELASLSRACPLLRTARFASATSALRVEVRVGTDRVSWTRAQSSTSVWNRETALCVRTASLLTE